MEKINWDTNKGYIDRIKEFLKPKDGDEPIGKEWKDFFEVLAKGESEGNYTAKRGDKYYGKYQFGEVALKDIEFFDRWSDKLDIKTMDDFLNSNIGQELAILESMSGVNTDRASRFTHVRSFFKDGDRAIFDNYLDESKEIEVKFDDGTIKTLEFTKSGISAAAHLLGAQDLSGLLKQAIDNQTISTNNAADGNGIAFTTYMNSFAGYNIDPLIAAPSNDITAYKGFVNTLFKSVNIISHDLSIGGKEFIVDQFFPDINFSDIFDFSHLTDSTTTDMDIIEDFQQGKDKIDLSDLFDPSELGEALAYNIEEGDTLLQDHNSDFAVKIIGEFDLGPDDFIF